MTIGGGQLLWRAIAETQIAWRKNALAKTPGFWKVGAETTTADTRPNGQRSRMIGQVVEVWKRLADEAKFLPKLVAIVPWHDDYISLRWTDQRRVNLEQRIPYWLSLGLAVDDQVIHSWITPKLAGKLAARLGFQGDLAEVKKLLKEYDALDKDEPADCEEDDEYVS